MEIRILLLATCLAGVSGFMTAPLLSLHTGSRFWIGDVSKEKGGEGKNQFCFSVHMGNGYEGEIQIQIKRSFGDKFFIKGKYTTEERPAPREWAFQRTWADFVALDRGIRSDPELSQKGGMQVSKLPPEPYVVGEGSSFVPFQMYLDQVCSLNLR